MKKYLEGIFIFIGLERLLNTKRIPSKMKIICVFGESTTWGAYDEEKGGWVTRLQLKFWSEGEYEIEVYNLGVSDQTTKSLLERFEAEAKSRNPEIIIFSTAKNDASYEDGKPLVPIEQCRANLKRLIELSRKFTDKIVLLGAIDIDDSKTMPIPWNTRRYYSNEKFQEYSNMIEEVCNQEKVHFINLQGLMDKEDFWEDDSLHPNERGHEKIANRVKEFLINNKLI